MEPFTSQDVQTALDTLGTGIRIQTFETSTATSAEAAASIGTSLGSIVKSLVFMVDGQPLVILASGDQRIDTRKLAAMYAVSRKKVKVATTEECVTIVGYAPGGVPPVGHRSHVPIVIDQTLGRYEMVYAAAGAPNAIFPIPYPQLVDITGGQVADVVVEAGSEETP
ncbi:MAG: YbaK/EbsC family protein [Anaerolineae bacterium]|nr:YbaK/EbsC family protein [Anaerolineae bacterium]